MLNQKQLEYFLKSAAITHAAAMYEAAHAIERTKTEENVTFAAGVQSAIEDLEEALALGTGQDPEGSVRKRFCDYSQKLLDGLNMMFEKSPEVFDKTRTVNVAAVIAERLLGCPRAGSPFHLEGLVS
ncbi:hypothetical protein [Corynebacterium fournieri]|uniref:hypothetical protein n=1 Tax=Corynebacterium fournieri TaxID=1852390 RepID=UPI000A2F52DE|nr:hypothetical protein [Corynebacterium fournieri]WJY97200.1 hypothetical protein CFOUR_03865 [Corynebacterium fournieri]